MDASFVYDINFQTSERFRGVDAYYHFLINGQEEKWDIWWNSQAQSSAKEILKKQKIMFSMLNGLINLNLFRPAVYKDGKLAGNEESFLASFHRGEKDFFDILD
jgi:hypothetical protein